MQYLNKTYDSDVPLVLMNSFNTDDDTQALLRKYSGNRITVKSFNQVRQSMSRTSMNSFEFLPVPVSAHFQGDQRPHAQEPR